MQDNIEKSDFRIVRTTKMLNSAMFSLLKGHTFKRITVRDICEEALISRATFYARFADKYDFLKSWLINLIPAGLDENSTLDESNKIYNDNFYKHKSIIRNLIIDSDSETLEILAEFIITYFMLADKYDIKQVTAEQVVLSNFFAGGMMFYIMWQVKNKFPPDVTPMNKYLYELIKIFRKWESDTL